MTCVSSQHSGAREGQIGGQNQIHLVFSHLEHGPNNGCARCSCAYRHGPVPLNVNSESDHNAKNQCPYCGLPCNDSTDRQPSEDQIVDSLNSLSLSNHPHARATPPGDTSLFSSPPPLSHLPLACHEPHGGQFVPSLSCRQQAHAAAACLDDTTVDDLAGYFDQLLHLPKPMSDMAELMYT